MGILIERLPGEHPTDRFGRVPRDGADGLMAF